MWDVGIIGSGSIGTAVAMRLVALGHRVLMANSRGPDSLGEKAGSLAIIPASVQEAANARDFVLIAIPEHAIAALPSGLFANKPSETVVLDAGNYYSSRDGEIAAIEAGLYDSEWVSSQIGCPVLKMFNTIHAARIVDSGKPAGTEGRICLPVAGDDPAAKAKAFALAEAMGFDALDAGTLAESWRQQPGTPGYCRDLDLAGMRDALAQAQPARAATYRAEALEKVQRLAAAGVKLGRLD